MEFDEHEEQEEIPPENYNSGRVRKSGTGSGSAGGGGYRYRECLKNHAVGIGGNAVDGCGEFMAAGDDGTLDGLICAACNCHRNFHRKEIEGQHRLLQHHYLTPPPYYHHHHHQQQHHQNRPAGYLQLTPSPGMLTQHQRPLALPSTEDLEEISNPSSSGGGGGGGNSGGIGGSKKRFRTKFSTEQKDRMLAFSESLGWRIQKQDEGAVQQFCAETGVKRSVLKVWMHNNKHTIGKKP